MGNFYAFLAENLPIFEKIEICYKKSQNFSIVFSIFCNFLERKVKIYSKISLTFAKEKCRISGTPSRGSPKG